MIHLTRLNNQPLVLNADLIKFIEKSPDTVITLVTGEKLVVRESVDDVLKRVSEFQQRFSRRVTPIDLISSSPAAAADPSSSGKHGEHGEPK